ncbi:MAG: hypothetical protein ABI972_09940 [Acidobacteriota bacterium]
MRQHSFVSPRNRQSSTRGSALLEAALVLAVFAPLAVMAGRYAWSFYQFQSLHSAVEDSARFGASASMRDGEGAWKESVRQFALCGSPKPCARPRVEQLRPENVQVELLRSEGSPASVRVSIQGFSIALPGGTKRFEGTPSAQFPRLEPVQ